MPPEPLENAAEAEKIARLRSELKICNSQRPEFKRSSPLHKRISQLVFELVKLYRVSQDFCKELELYESQQKYYSDHNDERGVIPWEIYKGLCYEEYGKREEAIQQLEKGFQLWQQAAKTIEGTWGSRIENSTDQLSWTFLWFPKAGKLLCQSYVDQGRESDAAAVASTCYAAMRCELLEFAPTYVNLMTFLHNFIHWAEIAGNMYSAAKQKYLAKHLYQITISDLSRLDWDSPRTRLHSAEFEFFKNIFQRKIERLEKDESDDDSDDDTKPTIPLSRSFRLVTILPSSNISAPIRCTTSTVDFAAAPPYKALSYVWGGSRKVVSYKGIGGPINEAEDTEAIDKSLRIILVDDVERMVRPNLFAALQELRQHQSPLVIWVDAICMEVNAMERRGEWAIKLRDIYKKAEQVVVWLGQGDEQSDKAMNFLHRFWSLRPTLYNDLGEYLFATTTTVPWKEVCALLRREWWERIWTLQEFCVAQKLRIHCGKHSMPWSYLQEFTTFVDLESQTYRFPGEESSHLQPLIDFVKQRHEYITLVDEYRMEFGFPLEKLFRITEHCGSYDPKDKIFALLGLLDQRSAKISPKLDYRYCLCAVYTDMIVYMRIKDYADDKPMALAKMGTVLSDLGDHIYLWPAEKIEERCDGEKCGRRVMCFTNDFPRKQRTAVEMLDILNKEYEEYRKMKQLEHLTDALMMSGS